MNEASKEFIERSTGGDIEIVQGGDSPFTEEDFDDDDELDSDE